MHDFKSHFRRDFLAYCTRPVSVHLAMACVGCPFVCFSVFLISLKKQQNLMKIMFSCIRFPVWPYPPQNNDFLKFYTSKLYEFGYGELLSAVMWLLWLTERISISVFCNRNICPCTYCSYASRCANERHLRVASLIHSFPGGQDQK